MTNEELDAILSKLRRQKNDDAQYEAKKSEKDLPKSIWDTVSAFANTRGGTILLGIDEENDFAIVDGFDQNRICAQFRAGLEGDASTAKVHPIPAYDIERLEVDEKPILVITIEELGPDQKPCYVTSKGISKGSFKRVDDGDLHLTLNEIYSLQHILVTTDSDRHPVKEARFEDLNRQIYEATFAKASIIMPRSLQGAETTKAKLQRLNFMNSDSQVTKAGLLVAGNYPQQFFPKLCIDVAVHAGKGKAEPGKPRFLDRQLCDGTLGEMIEESLRVITRNLRTTSIVRGAARVDELEIPLEVLREALCNAVIHREYGSLFDGQSISVDIYSDRIEIQNPGSLWGGKVEETLDDGQSCCRNPTLMRLMSIVPLPSEAGSPAEGNGTGIILMINAMKERGLYEPIFKAGIDNFKVILLRSAYQEQKAKPELKDDELIILDLIRTNETLGTRELSTLSGLSVVQVRNRVKELLEKELIVATAPINSKNRKYKLATP